MTMTESCGSFGNNLFVVANEESRSRECMFVVLVCCGTLEIRAPSESKVLLTDVPASVVQSVGDVILSEYRAGSNVDACHLLLERFESQYIAGFLWYYLKDERTATIFPAEYFDLYCALVTKRGPVVDDAENVTSDIYIDAAVDGILPNDLLQIIKCLPPANRQSLFLILRLLSTALRLDSKLTSLRIANLISPILIKPKNSSFMSLRHRKGTVYARLIIVAFIEKLEMLEDEFRSDDPPSVYQVDEQEASEGQRAQLKVNKPKVFTSRSSSEGESFPSLRVQIPKLSIPNSVDSSMDSAGTVSSESGVRAQLSQILQESSKVQYISQCTENMKQILDHSATSNIDELQENSRSLIGDNIVPEQAIGKESPKYPGMLTIESYLSQYGPPGLSGSTSPGGQSTTIKRLQDLKARKREIKCKLRRFDEDFFVVNGRKPTRPEKESLRADYEEYHAVKREMQKLECLQPIEEKYSSMDRKGLKSELYRLEKILKDFEASFFEKQGRKISSPADIKGMETEYASFKYIRDLLSDS